MQLIIDKIWHGAALPLADCAQIRLEKLKDGLLLIVNAPFHHDILPDADPGFVDKLWEYEVVELFIAAEDNPAHYVEIELGPGGHYWAAHFQGIRREAGKLSLEYESWLKDESWQGKAKIAWTDLPKGRFVANAFSMHGQGEDRAHLAAYPVSGNRPDFHQPKSFVATNLSHPHQEDRAILNPSLNAVKKET
ncbi:MAG: hypothetical protein QGI45_01490 [Myxococcota bacterium]|jgi:hypothetical protein|nr:hypothetical protein [Myxococcota bacterium]